jgi:acyl-CoA synthetase (AMP-forming)/AMP-acid ligase II
MHPYIHAAANPDKPAVIMAETGQSISFGQLEAASNRVAQLIRSRGLGRGDVVAFMVANEAEYYTLLWGAQRTGVHFVCMSTRLTADEANYILENSGAKLFVLSAKLAHQAAAIETSAECFSLGGAIPGYASWEEAVAAMTTERIVDESGGSGMLYSSGTTGRPKGIKRASVESEDIAAPTALAMLAQALYRIGPDSIYLSPAPLYHAAPLGWSMAVHKLGGTVVLMEKFDAEGALGAIERYKVTCGQFVPTHFIRMLKLPEDIRHKYDLSTLNCAIHAAAPCPVAVKEAMIEWFGPVIEEYYAGTEGNGMTFINSTDWLAHKGSVGQAKLGIVHIVDEDGNDLPPRQEGTIYFEGATNFEYHNDPEKTAAGRNEKGWSTLGDVGWLDEEGYLYLTDRKSFMIISGGVNIYPQEIENHLIAHPKVQDVAVIGGPHDEMGEEVIAVVQPVDMAEAGDALRDELTAFAREKLSGVKIPRRIDFREELPRHDTGKLYKRLLRDEYWSKADGKTA